MTYPLSSDVIPGQPTAADHYNNLRADVLRLGHPTADAANLGDVLARYTSNLTIAILGTDRVRVPATTASPVALIIDAAPLLATVNVDLSAGGKPSGAPALWYLFAVRTDGSPVFTLEVNTSAVESAGRRLIGSFYWNGAAIEAPSIRTSQADAFNVLINHNQFVGCQGRLALNAGDPTFSDGTASQIYLIPYKGNQISFYTPGFGWNSYPIPTVSPPVLNLNGLVTTKVYDVFAYWDGTTVILENVAWSSLTSRAVSLTYQDGLYVKSTDHRCLYLGSFCPASTSSVDDLPISRSLWNNFNRLPRLLARVDTTANWIYTSSDWRQANAEALNQVRLVTGLPEDVSTFEVDVNVNAEDIDRYGLVGLGIDSTTVNSADILIHARGLAGDYHSLARARLRSILTIGCHDIVWLEATQGTGDVKFFGSNFSSQSQGGLTGLMMG